MNPPVNFAPVFPSCSVLGRQGSLVRNPQHQGVFLGVSSVIHPIGVNAASVFDLIILLLVTAIAMFFAITEKSINRKEGIVMLLFYVSYMIFAGTR